MAKQTHTKVRFMVSRTDPKSVKQHRRRRPETRTKEVTIAADERDTMFRDLIKHAANSYYPSSEGWHLGGYVILSNEEVEV
jgi:hypothetical protein